MVESYLDTVLIIDDSFQEIQGLKTLLEAKDIWVRYEHPKDLLNNKPKIKNRKLIFLDLYIDETKTKIEEQISQIRIIFRDCIGRDFGTYGVIVWTKHPEQVDELRKRIQRDANSYALPLYIISLDKSNYLAKGSFDSIISDIDNILTASTAASFFIKWSHSVAKGRDAAISNIFSLIKGYDYRDENLKFLLFQMARNLTGIPLDKIDYYPLDIDAFKAFNDMLYYEVSMDKSTRAELFKDVESIYYFSTPSQNTIGYHVRNDSFLKNDKKAILKNNRIAAAQEKTTEPLKAEITLVEKELKQVFASINSKMLIDTASVDQQFVFPGNIYEVLCDCPFKMDDLPQNAIPILIELTPPCDFAQKKMGKPRCVSGFMIAYDIISFDPYKGENYYKEMWPLMIEGFAEPQRMIFDFRYLGIIDETDLKRADNYKLLFRAKDKLFADIIQKFSAHIARLGLAVIR
ncbi:MAG: hypothetical protein EOP48_02265 [Sphingobacteriales bacterium]|nr:MAG: hypothetical protein EOP48_02265 [Sphingobacteriales bacterium]